jgi:hypothetical protein
MENFSKTILSYINSFLSGFLISTSFVLFVNDMFYHNTFRKLLIKDYKTDTWKELKPREVIGIGAKKTFIKHKIEDEGKESESKIYHEYIEQKRYSEDNKINNKLETNLINNKNI